MLVPILVAITFHEVAHGYTAYILGDPTAKNAGRLTLNPIKHLDPIGTIALFLIHIGWAKPVPIQPAFFEDPRRGLILTSLAGPAANIGLAAVFAALFHLLSFGAGGIIATGSPGLVQPLLYMCQIGVLINIALAVFNLLPVPPLDGSNILLGLLPPELGQMVQQYSTFGIVILIVLLFSGLVQHVIFPIIRGISSVFMVPMPI